MLKKYAKEHGFTNTRFYIDDGYTGTNFNRPDFQKMMEDIEMGYIKTVIVKDMSRFGRDYLTVGYYTDTYFPEGQFHRRDPQIYGNADADAGPSAGADRPH